SVFAYFATAYLLVDAYGAIELAIANTVQFIAHTLILGFIGRKRVAGVIRQAAPTVGICLLAGGVSAGAAWLTSRGLLHLLSGRIAEISAVIFPVGLAAAIYAMWVLAAGVPEARALVNRLSGGFRPDPMSAGAAPDPPPDDQ
ncbi:MAG TPA: hypothetical protein PK691_06770, partial [Thermomicrobiales bacterium]|nr:hypothetical protein [Thermomicrobiales bacterium]